MGATLLEVGTLLRDISSIRIRASADEVREVLLSPRTLPQYGHEEGIEFVGREQDATLFRSFPKRGRDAEAHLWRLEDHGSEVVHDLLSGSGPSTRTRYILHEEADETRVILEREREPHGIIAGVQSLLHWTEGERKAHDELAAIKRIVEGRPRTVG